MAFFLVSHYPFKKIERGHRLSVFEDLHRMPHLFFQLCDFLILLVVLVWLERDDVMRNIRRARWFPARCRRGLCLGRFRRPGRRGSLALWSLRGIEEVIFDPHYHTARKGAKRSRKDQELPPWTRFEANFAPIRFGSCDFLSDRHHAIRLHRLLKRSIFRRFHQDQVILRHTALLYDFGETGSFHNEVSPALTASALSPGRKDLRIVPKHEEAV